MGRSSSVSGEALHLPDLHLGELRRGWGVAGEDQQVFPRQGLRRLADVALLLLLG